MSALHSVDATRISPASAGAVKAVGWSYLQNDERGSSAVLALPPRLISSVFGCSGTATDGLRCRDGGAEARDTTAGSTGAGLTVHAAREAASGAFRTGATLNATWCFTGGTFGTYDFAGRTVRIEARRWRRRLTCGNRCERDCRSSSAREQYGRHRFVQFRVHASWLPRPQDA